LSRLYIAEGPARAEAYLRAVLPTLDTSKRFIGDQTRRRPYSPANRPPSER